MTRNKYSEYLDLLDASQYEKDMAQNPKGALTGIGTAIGTGLGFLIGGPVAGGLGAALGGGAGAIADMANEKAVGDEIAKVSGKREQLAATLEGRAEDEELRRQAILGLARKYQQFV